MGISIEHWIGMGTHMLLAQMQLCSPISCRLCFTAYFGFSHFHGDGVVVCVAAAAQNAGSLATKPSFGRETKNSLDSKILCVSGTSKMRKLRKSKVLLTEIARSQSK
mmetsp:Transcript_4941/g.7266  ORF Transcript_4941/g.7266 Transcript_4941/m.7266 type:complete len:107 (+) Transcript_4941:961-1281(+)